MVPIYLVGGPADMTKTYLPKPLAVVRIPVMSSCGSGFTNVDDDAASLAHIKHKVAEYRLVGPTPKNNIYVYEFDEVK